MFYRDQGRKPFEMNLYKGVRSALIITFVILVVLATCTGCKVVKQIQKTDTETQTESKSDSASTVHNDKITESKTLTETTEVIDSVVFITPKGELISDTTGHKGKLIPVPIKKKKVTKTNQEIKEVDKTQTKTAIKKHEEKKSEVKTVQKDITKTRFPLWIWLLLAIAVLGWGLWRFYLRR